RYKLFPMLAKTFPNLKSLGLHWCHGDFKPRSPSYKELLGSLSTLKTLQYLDIVGLAESSCLKHNGQNDLCLLCCLLRDANQHLEISTNTVTSEMNLRVTQHSVEKDGYYLLRIK